MTLVFDLFDLSGFLAVGLGVYCSLRIAKVFAITHLASPFCAAAATVVGVKVLEARGYLSVPTALVVVLIAVGAVGGFSSLSFMLLKRVGRLDRITSALLAYFLVRSLALVLAPEGVAAPSAELESVMRASESVKGILSMGIVLAAGLALGLAFETTRGLRFRAFGGDPERATRFGFDSRWILPAPLLAAEALLALVGAGRIVMGHSMSPSWGFEAVLIGAAAASAADVLLPRSRTLARLLGTGLFVTFWKLVKLNAYKLVEVIVGQGWGWGRERFATDLEQIATVVLVVGGSIWLHRRAAKKRLEDAI